MTPWQFKACLEAANAEKEDQHDHAVWIAHHQATWMRLKRIPPMDRFMAAAARKKAVEGEGKNPVPQIDETAIIARMKAHNAQVKKAKK